MNVPLWARESASRGRRFAENMVDSLVYLLVAYALSLILLEAFETDVSKHPYLFCYAVFVLYYIALEGAWGKTIGKVLLRTGLAKETGGPIAPTDAFGRTLIRCIPLEGFSAFASDRKMWHDRWTETVVRSTGRLSVKRKLLVACIIIFSFGAVCCVASLNAEVRAKAAWQKRQSEALREAWNKQGRVGEFYSPAAREAFLGFMANHLPDLCQRLLQKPWTEATAEDGRRLGAIVSQQLVTRGLAALRQDHQALVDRTEEIVAELGAKNLTHEEVLELWDLQRTQADGKSLSVELRTRGVVLLDKLFQNYSEEEKARLTEYYSTSMLLGIDALRHEDERR